MTESRDEAVTIYTEHSGKDAPAILDEILSWNDANHATFIAGFMLLMMLAGRGQMPGGMSLDDYLDFMISKGGGFGRGDFPEATLRDCAAMVAAASPTPSPNLLHDFASLFTRDELRNIGW